MTNLSTEASIGLLKRVPGGHLRGGSTFHPRELVRRHTIFVREFEIAGSSVTVNQFAAFLNAGGYEHDAWWGDEGREWLREHAEGWGRQRRGRPEAWEQQRNRPHHPVVGVTCFEAEAYCRWLSAEKGCRVRLPTEDEWERAARGDDRRPYPWGEVFDPSLANTWESDLRDTVPAASVSGDISPFGVMDMAGNVQEWTASPYTRFPGEVLPEGPLRIVRGGSFNDTAYGSRTSYRRAYPPGYYFPFLGFRVAVDVH